MACAVRREIGRRKPAASTGVSSKRLERAGSPPEESPPHAVRVSAMAHRKELCRAFMTRKQTRTRPSTKERRPRLWLKPWTGPTLNSEPRFRRQPMNTLLTLGIFGLALLREPWS